MALVVELIQEGKKKKELKITKKKRLCVNMRKESEKKSDDRVRVEKQKNITLR